ncbi:MAG: glycosyltransferase family 2 protein [Bacteroidetes bacterium]|nr:glycosyltransferase family 2 protein [Bacteroidota bacterium]
MQNLISIIIITKNEEKNIEQTLQSVLWADEIIIIDCFSTDNTKQIATKYPVNFIEKKWEGFSSQKSFALQQATNNFVLSIDADEVVTEELRIEIQNLLKSEIEFDAYFISRKNYFLGKWIKSCGWYPDYQIRFGKKDKLFLTNREVHESFESNGRIGYLKNSIDHFTYDSIHHYFEKFNNYTTLDVEAKLLKTKGNINWTNLILNPISQFLRMFLSKKGYKDGLHGLVVSLLSSFYTLVVYAKCWEKLNSKKK